MNKFTWLLIILLLSLISHLSYATTANYHISHDVYSKRGQKWIGHAAVISGTEQFYFTDRKGKRYGKHYDFVTNKDSSSFYINIDKSKPIKFDMAYSIEVTQANADNSHYTNKTCVFIITLDSYGYPAIKHISYNGAQCRENFYGGIMDLHAL